MKNLLFFASLIMVSVACTKPSDVEPTTSTEGTYQAKDYDHFNIYGYPITYPINGQTVTLQINYITVDTANVQIIPSATAGALPSGIYSPTQTLSYPKAVVVPPTAKNAATYILLNGRINGPVSTANPQIWIYSDKKTADYFFVPTQDSVSVRTGSAKVIRFLKN